MKAQVSAIGSVRPPSNFGLKLKLGAGRLLVHFQQQVVQVDPGQHRRRHFPQLLQRARLADRVQAFTDSRARSPSAGTIRTLASGPASSRPFILSSECGRAQPELADLRAQTTASTPARLRPIRQCAYRSGFVQFAGRILLLTPAAAQSRRGSPARSRSRICVRRTRCSSAPCHAAVCRRAAGLPVTGLACS